MSVDLPAARRHALWSLAVVALIAALLLFSEAGRSIAARLEASLFDLQVRWLRAIRPAADSVLPDIALVGIDEATLAALDEPLALAHASLGAALSALAQAGPRLIALDIALPARSFDSMRPGLDAALATGLIDAREAAGVVFVLQPDAQGRITLPHAPFVAAAGHSTERPVLALALLPLDADRVIRRFDPNVGQQTILPKLQTFVSLIAERVGAPVPTKEGWIDFTRGAPFQYQPLIDVLRRQRAGDGAWLRSQFKGRVVLLGSVLPYIDRYAAPVDLVGWEYPNTMPPGVILHAQALRSALGAGFIVPVPTWLQITIIAAFALLAAIPSALGRLLLLGAAISASFGAALLAHASGTFVPLAVAWLAGGTGVGLRSFADLMAARRERRRLVLTFGGYVSPQVLDAIVAGRLESTAGRRQMAFLFADLRGFTAWSEHIEPDEALRQLNRYYAAITPVIHRHGGTIDNFRGDGIMVMFGAPAPQSAPCIAAFDAVIGVFAAAEALNRQGGSMGLVFEVAIGLAYGEAVFGDLGSDDRKDFTALGDAVNVAARLQELTRAVGFPVLMSAEFAQQLSAAQRAAYSIQSLGEAALRNHSPVRIAGWRPGQAEDSTTFITKSG